jgi:hypothetical protein
LIVRVRRLYLCCGGKENIEMENAYDYKNVDAVCCVLANKRDKQTIDLVLNHYIPTYTPLAGDYACPQDQPDVVFQSENEMVNYFCENKTEENSLFWKGNNPLGIMVGALFTKDKQLIISLTLAADGKIEKTVLKELKKLLGSKIGVINYFNLPEFEDGRDFKKRYKTK